MLKPPQAHSIAMPLVKLALLLLFAAPLSAQTTGWDVLWEYDGQGMDNLVGSAVAGGADLNLDGFDDFMIGALGITNDGIEYSGAFFAYSGIDGTLIHEIHGDDTHSNLGGNFGSSLAMMGDVNGDGYPEMAVGAASYSPDIFTLSRAGAAFVYSGLDGSLLWQVNGEAPWSFLGNAMATAGDLNGDGIHDLLVGASWTTVSGMGRVGRAFVYSGVDGSILLELNGPAQVDTQFGYSVAYAGDVDSDGSPDYLIGALGHKASGSSDNGGAFLYSGATGALLYQYEGQWRDYMGASVAGGSDFNADGIPDFLIGSPSHAPGGVTGLGSVFMHSGADGSLIRRFDGEVTGSGSAFGRATCVPGDFNADGVDDIAIGASGTSFAGGVYAGSIYLFSGLDGTLIDRYDCPHQEVSFGQNLASAGDMTLSGTPDLVAGGGNSSSSGTVRAGYAAVIFDLGQSSNSDDDEDSLPYFREMAIGTDPLDQDSDDDGFSDGEEYFGTGPNMTAPTDPALVDSDNDGLQDGTELMLTTITWTGNPPLTQGTDPAVFQPDLDPLTQTDPLIADSDSGGMDDGGEDVNANGRIDIYETDPLNPADDRVPGTLLSDLPTIEASQSQITVLTLDFAGSFASHNYQILGSTTGTSPGFAYQGIQVPLVLDTLTMLLASGSAPPMMVYFNGQLDPQGDAVAYLATRSGEVSSFVGQTVWFAAVTIDPSSQLLSNSTTVVALQIVP